MRIHNYTKEAVFVTKIIKPIDTWSIKWDDYPLMENRKALVHFMHEDLKVIVPLGWVKRFGYGRYWTAYQRYLCYYSVDPREQETMPRGNFSAGHAKKLDNNNGRMYTVHVLEIHCKFCDVCFILLFFSFVALSNLEYLGLHFVISSILFIQFDRINISGKETCYMIKPISLKIVLKSVLISTYLFKYCKK